MVDPFTYDVFLSHNTRDKPRVRKLAERLRDAGLRVWFDEWVIEPGDDIYLAIERGLEAARVQVLCLSPAALGSDWVTLERNTALFRDPTNAGRRFIPLLLADCELPDTLRRYSTWTFARKPRWRSTNCWPPAGPRRNRPRPPWNPNLRSRPSRWPAGTNS